MKFKKIAISGKANSGKNTLCELIKSKWNFSSANYAFADTIKEIALQIFPQLDKNILWGPSHLRETKIPNLEFWGLEKGSMTYRELLCKLGEQNKLIFGDDVWVNTIFYRVKSHYYANNPNHLTIISDIRFKNELKMCKNENFLLVRIKRDNVQQINRKNHISELDLNDIRDEDFDVIIENSSGIDNLKLQAQALFNTWIDGK